MDSRIYSSVSGTSDQRATKQNNLHFLSRQSKIIVIIANATLQSVKLCSKFMSVHNTRFERGRSHFPLQGNLFDHAKSPPPEFLADLAFRRETDVLSRFVRKSSLLKIRFNCSVGCCENLISVTARHGEL